MKRLVLALMGLFALGFAFPAQAQLQQVPTYLANSPIVSTPSNFINDGAAFPWTTEQITPSQIHVHSTNTTWFFWSGWQVVSGSYKKVVEVATYNWTTNVWSANYVVSSDTLVGDIHGIPTAVRDANGRVWVFYGSHASDLHISVSTNPDDPSAWTATTDIGGPVTFPRGYLVGSSLYLFYTTLGGGGATEESLSVRVGTVTGASVSWGSAKSLVDFSGNWLFPGDFIQVGSTIVMSFNWATTTPPPNRNVYYAAWNTATGDLCNFTAGTCTATASQPISQATADTSYRIVDQTGRFGGGVSMNIDQAGATHILYEDSTADDGSATTDILHIVNSGSGWSSPHTVFTYTGCVPSNVSAEIVPRGSGVDVWYPDNVTLPVTNCIGNMWRVNRSSGGTWGSATEVLAATNYGLASPSPVRPNTSDGFLAFAELVSFGDINNTTVSGVLKGYVYRNGGYLPRASIPVPAYLGPGDFVSSAKAWYGLRAYSAATRGSAIANVCNSTGGVDVGCADVLSDATTGALVPKTISGITCPGPNCTVKTLYDQSGANTCTGAPCNLAQATVASRPVLAANCLGSKPCMQFSGGQGVHNASTASIAQPWSVTGVYTTTAAGAIFVSSTGAYEGLIAVTPPGQMQFWTGAHINAGAANNGSIHAVAGVANGASSLLRVDGLDTSVFAGGADAFQNSDWWIGNDTFNEALTGTVTEAGIWGAAFTATQRTDLCFNESIFWSATPHC